MVKAAFSSSFSSNVMTFLSIGSVRVDYYAFTNSFRHCFKPYTKAYVAFYLASSGNATTMLSNAVIYSYTEPHYHSSHNLSLAMFLLSSGEY